MFKKNTDGMLAHFVQVQTGSIHPKLGREDVIIILDCLYNQFNSEDSSYEEHRTAWGQNVEGISEDGCYYIGRLVKLIATKRQHAAWSESGKLSHLLLPDGCTDSWHPDYDDPLWGDGFPPEDCGNSESNIEFGRNPAWVGEEDSDKYPYDFGRENVRRGDCDGVS